MYKNNKRYAIVLAIVLLFAGLFILFKFYSKTKPFEAAQATSLSAKTAVTEQIVDPAVKSLEATQTNSPASMDAQVASPNQIASKPGEAGGLQTANLTSCLYPSQILELTNWKQTLPAGASNKPTEIKQASLSSYSEKSYFRPNSTCDGVVFRAPVNGVTTSNSGYPRSELREMIDGGKNLASWSTTVGTNSMFIDQAITAVPKTKKHVVAGQIHDAADDVVVIRLEYPKLFVDINGKEGPTLDSNYTLGKRFTINFVASEGQIKIYYNGSAVPAFAMKKASSKNYFKAGAYTQSNCSKEQDCSANNFGEVVIYKLSVQH